MIEFLRCHMIVYSEVLGFAVVAFRALSLLVGVRKVTQPESH